MLTALRLVFRRCMRFGQALSSSQLPSTCWKDRLGLPASLLLFQLLVSEPQRLIRKLSAKCVYLVSSVATNYATDGIGPARGMWNQAVQERVSITSSMLSQIKGLKMMGLTDYIAKLIQSLRASELELSKKFRAFIIRIIVIGTLYHTCMET